MDRDGGKREARSSDGAEWFDETSLPWTLPSPNLPTLDSATVYPGQVIIEGTNLSEGRGHGDSVAPDGRAGRPGRGRAVAGHLAVPEDNGMRRKQ